MPGFLSTLSDWLPLSYAVDAMKAVTTQTAPDVWVDFAVMGAWIIVSLVLGSLTLRRRTA
jgi:ABC-2 type transport system permease protein